MRGRESERARSVTARFGDFGGAIGGDSVVQIRELQTIGWFVVVAPREEEEKESRTNDFIAFVEMGRFQKCLR